LDLREQDSFEATAAACTRVALVGIRKHSIQSTGRVNLRQSSSDSKVDKRRQVFGESNRITMVRAMSLNRMLVDKPFSSSNDRCPLQSAALNFPFGKKQKQNRSDLFSLQDSYFRTLNQNPNLSRNRRPIGQK